ncbi:MAG: hypothetical protein QF615_07285, partial [Planctomycetota bacterium]|nr:hypothetical protein [Planctomycetota bacterium]
MSQTPLQPAPPPDEAPPPSAGLTGECDRDPTGGGATSTLEASVDIRKLTAAQAQRVYSRSEVFAVLREVFGL